MKLAEFYQKMYTSYADAELVANAFEQYYKRVYERTIEQNKDIVEATGSYEPYEDKTVFVPICYQDNITYYVDTNELKNEFAKFNNLVETEGIDNSTYYIKVKDLVSQIDVELNIADVANALGDAADSCYLTWQGFSAVASKSLESAQDFYNTVSLKVNQSSTVITNTASNIYSVLANTGNSIVEKLESMISFVGLDLAATDPAAVTTADIDLKEFTGLSPVITWLSGVDWTKLGRGVISTLFTIRWAVTKFCYNCIKTVFVGLGKLVGKLFSWFGGLIKRTFIDPVDYECSDSYLEYFKIPAKAVVRMPYYHGSWSTHDCCEMYKDVDGDGSTWYSEGAVYYRVLPFDVTDYPVDNFGDPLWGEGFRPIYFERYVKPISPEKVHQVLSQFFTIESGTTVWTTPNGLTRDAILEALGAINSADLSIAKKTPEKQVYYGTILSLYFAQECTKSKCKFLQNYCSGSTYEHLTLSSPALLEDVDTTLPLSPTIDEPEFYLERVLRIMYELSGIVSGYLQSSDVSRIIRVMGLAVDYSNLKSSITNADFIEVLTTFDSLRVWITYSNDVGTFNTAHYSISALNTAASGYYKGYMDLLTWSQEDGLPIAGWNNLWEGLMFDATSMYPGSMTPFLPDSLILYSTRVLQPGTEFDGAYIPYLQGHTPKFKQNVSIVTDSQHNAQVTNFIKGAAVLAAAVVAGIVVGQVAVSLIKKYKTTTWTRDTIAFDYGSALYNGDKERAEALYKKYKGYNLKANLLGLCMGKTSSVAGSTLHKFSEDIGIGLSSNEDVIKLIKPQS